MTQISLLYLVFNTKFTHKLLDMTSTYDVITTQMCHLLFAGAIPFQGIYITSFRQPLPSHFRKKAKTIIDPFFVLLIIISAPLIEWENFLLQKTYYNVQ